MTRQPKAVPYPPYPPYPSYPMWYNTIPPYVPMDHNMYSMYYSKIKRPNPLIFGRKERYVVGII